MSSLTIFEKVKKLIPNEEGATPEFYRNSVRKIAASYKKNLDRVVREEKSDRTQKLEKQDENILRRYPLVGHLYLFEYDPKIKHLLPYYDTFPLAYVLKVGEDHFYAANLHYFNPKRRLVIVEDLKNKRVNIPSVCIHKYIDDHVNGLLLDIAESEWDSVINLPIDNFKKIKNGKETSHSATEVWTENASLFNTKTKSDRKVRRYPGDARTKGFAPPKKSSPKSSKRKR